MTGATTSAAGSAVAETVNGNMSYGNVSLGNAQMGNVSELQRNHNSLLASGGHKLDTGGVMIINDAKGFSVMQRRQDSGERSIYNTMVDTVSITNGLKDLRSEQQTVSMRLGYAESVMENSRAPFSERISQMTAEDIAYQYNMTLSSSQNLLDAVHQNQRFDMGRQYSGGTNAQYGMGFGGSGSAKDRLLSLFSGNVGTSAHASNTQNFGDSESAFNEMAYNKNNATIENAMKHVANSGRNDELTSHAKEYANAKQEVTSLTKDQANIQARIDQTERALQNMQSTTLTVSGNAMKDYVKMAQKQNPHLTENQAKEQFFTANANNPAHQRVLKEMQSQNTARYNTEASKYKTPDVSETNFSKDEMQQRYANEKTKIETRMASTEKEITKGQLDVRNKKNASEQNFKIKDVETSNKITEGQRNIKDGKEQIKNSVDKRASHGSIREATMIGSAAIVDAASEVWDALKPGANKVTDFVSGSDNNAKPIENLDNKANASTVGGDKSKERIKNDK